MCDFTGADQALLAAEAMQVTVAGEEGRVQPNLSIHVGCHLGQVIENAGDLFGDTVNIAARIAGVAGAGQIIVTQQTVEALGPALQLSVRPLDRVSVKGQSDGRGFRLPVGTTWRCHNRGTAGGQDGSLATQARPRSG
jgi:class 3 adenylate cyclase